jgi:SAM-dependent methyltransferase
MSTFSKLQRLHRTGMIGMAIRGAVGAQVSRIGDAVGSETLTYNSWTFDMFYRLAVETAPAIVNCVLKRYPETHRVVDLGAGTGAHVAEFKRRGVDCVGFEYSARARQVGHERLDVLLEPFDLTDPDPWDGEHYDLAVSLEVAEHLPPLLGERLVETCTKAAPRVLFSAAPPGQGGQGHINEQPKAYWLERFARHGYALNEPATELLVADLRAELIRGMHIARNVMLIEKRSAGAAKQAN